MLPVRVATVQQVAENHREGPSVQNDDDLLSAVSIREAVEDTGKTGCHLTGRFTTMGSIVGIPLHVCPEIVVLVQIGECLSFPPPQIVLTQLRPGLDGMPEGVGDGASGMDRALQIAAMDRSHAGGGCKEVGGDASSLPMTTIGEGRIGRSMPHSIDIGLGFAMAHQKKVGDCVHGRGVAWKPGTTTPRERWT